MTIAEYDIPNAAASRDRWPFSVSVLIPAMNEGATIGSYPLFRDGRNGANFVIRATDGNIVDKCAEELADGLRAMGREAVDGGI